MRHLVAAFFVTLACASTAAQAATPASFADMVEPRLAAVVNISTTQKVQGGPGGFPGFDMENMPNDPKLEPFRDLFKQFEDQFGRSFPKNGPAKKATSLGSGFVIAPEGYIVTNNHVISAAEEISVTFHDDTKLPARLIGRDTKTDLALLKVDSKKALPFVNFGSSDELRVGDWVVAVGNPFGLGGSVSAGIVSARGRNINVGPFDDFIQTDAAINRGNSGGPLFNANGEVVGINSAIFSPTGGSVGIGFAVPSSLAKPIIEQLRKNGHAQRALLGVRIQEVSDDIAKSLGLPNKNGALVIDIDKKGPADGSGILPGDVITSFEGKPILQMRNLPRMVAESPIGKTVTISVWRNGKTQNYQVKLGKLPGDSTRPILPKKTSDETVPPGIKHEMVLGASLQEITPELRQQYRLAADAKGLMVTAVDPAGTLARVGVRPGDVILQVNQTVIEEVEDLKREAARATAQKRDAVLMRVQRGSNSQFITVLIDPKN